ncbi:hypothetical protein ACRAWF_36650 [Streptomyces sp. L7]
MPTRTPPATSSTPGPRKLTELDGTADVFIAAGLHGYQFANAAEIMRGYPGFDLARFQKMLVDVFYSRSSDFLAHHNGAYVTNYWGSCGPVEHRVRPCHRHPLRRPRQGRRGGHLLQVRQGQRVRQEPHHAHLPGRPRPVGGGRPRLGHATLGVGLAGAIAEMAWNQGIDLYGYDDNRLLKGFEYRRQAEPGT